MDSNEGLLAVLVISVAIAGYFFSTNCYLLKYRTARQSDQRIYLTSVSVGFAFAALAWIILEVSRTILEFVLAVLCEHCQLCYQISSVPNTAVLIIFTPLLSIISTLLYNQLPDTKNKNLRREWEQDDFSSLLMLAADEKEPLAITLDSRKVYIGLLAVTNEPTPGTAHITLLPLYSGYRTSAGLRLKILHRYDEVFDFFDPAKPSQIDDIRKFNVVLPMERIVSAHIFHAKVYDRFNGNSGSTI